MLHAAVISRFYSGAPAEAVWTLALTSPVVGSPFELWLGVNADRWEKLIDTVAGDADPILFSVHRKIITIARASLPAYRECMSRVAESWGGP